MIRTPDTTICTRLFILMFVLSSALNVTDNPKMTQPELPGTMMTLGGDGHCNAFTRSKPTVVTLVY